NLKWLQFVGAGVEWYAGSGLAERGITVTTASGVGGPAIAEYVLAGVLTLFKGIPARIDLQKAHRWQAVRVRTLRESTVLVVGLGGIGKAVAGLAKAFGARVIAVRRAPEGPQPDGVDDAHPPSALRVLLPRADVVVLCAALTPETRGMIGAAELDAMRPGAV